MVLFRHIYVGLPDLAARREILQTRLSEILLCSGPSDRQEQKQEQKEEEEEQKQEGEEEEQKQEGKEEEGDDVLGTLEGLASSSQAAAMTGADWKGVIDTAFLQASAQYAKAQKKAKEAPARKAALVVSASTTTTTATTVTTATTAMNHNFPITSAHFMAAFEQIQPSLSAQQLRFYASIHSKFMPRAAAAAAASSASLATQQQEQEQHLAALQNPQKQRFA